MRITRISTFIGLFFIQFGLVHANLTISPLKYEFNVNPGETKQEVIKVTNDSPSPVTLYTSKEDFIAGDDTGTPTFVKPKDKATDDFSLSNWIQLDNGNITLAKNETREVRFTVKVPKDGEPGGHYGAIFFSPGAPSGAQVAVVQRLGVLLLINVSGDVKIGGSLTDFKIGKETGKKFAEANDFSSFPIIFDTRFQNDGNVHIKPTGKITITDDNGEQLKNIGKESITSPSGAFVGEKLVDYIPVNDTLGNILPKSSRKFESIWQGFGYQELREDGAKVVKFKDLDSYYSDTKSGNKKFLSFWETVKTRKIKKNLTATLDLSYTNADNTKKDFQQKKNITVSFTEQYVGINNWLIFIIVLVLAGAGYYFFAIAPKQKERLKSQLLEELRKRG